MNLKNKKLAFTLSEVLITITLIGFLATMTLSTIGSSVQQRARLAEFRTAYSKLNATLKDINILDGRIYSCYQIPTETQEEDFGLRLSVDVDATNDACEELERAFISSLGSLRTCDNPVQDKCVPAKYSALKDECSSIDATKAYVLENSTILMIYGDFHTVAIDVNGRKGPNKWGQDIFPLTLKVTETKSTNGINYVKDVKFLPPDDDSCTYAVKSGKNTTQMIQESANFKKRKQSPENEGESENSNEGN